MSVRKPAEADIKARAREIIQETEAYPEDTRERLLSIKRAALQSLVDRFEDEMEVIAGHYPGWSREDLESLLTHLK